MIECPKCGKKNSLDNKFCGECGAELPEPKNYCPRCNITHKKGEKFCTKCGNKLVSQTEYESLKELDGELKDDLDWCNEKLKSDPQNDKILSFKGHTLLLLSEYTGNKESMLNESLDCFKNSLRIKPDNYEDTYKIALIYEKLGQYENMLSYYDKCIELEHPYEKVIRYQKGRYYMDKKDYHQALNCFDEAIKCYPKDAAFWAQKAECHKELEDFGEWFKCLQKANKLYESDPKKYENWGIPPK